MKLILYFLCALSIFPAIQCTQHKSETASKTSDEMTKEYVSTFQFEKADRIIIESYNKMSDQNDSLVLPKKAEIIDEPTIARISELAKVLPDKGEIMKKIGDVSLLEVKLVYKDKVLYFDYYRETIKTPDTSFYVNPPAEEKQLYDLLISLVK
jgi:hypothetical protein